MNIKNYLFLFIGIGAGALVIMLFSWGFDSFWIKETEPYILETFMSPDLSHKVEIIADAAPVWSFGGQDVHIEFDDMVSTKSIYMNTDGRDFRDYAVEWDVDKAIIVLNVPPNEQVTYEASFYNDGVKVKCISELKIRE